MRSVVVRFRPSGGIQEIRVSLGGVVTVRDLMAKLADEASGELKATARQIRDNPRAGFIVVLNGTYVQSLKGLDAPIEDGDTVSILPVMAGG